MAKIRWDGQRSRRYYIPLATTEQGDAIYIAMQQSELAQ